MKVLLADPDPQARDLIQAGFSLVWPEATCIPAGDGEVALERWYQFGPDLVIIDLNLPRRSGLQVVREMRHTAETPVVVTAFEADAQSQVKVLQAGADLVLSKPLNFPVFAAHVRALMRRAGLDGPSTTPQDFDDGHLSIRFETGEVYLEGAQVRLTRVEYAVLYHLVRSAGRLIPHRVLLDRVWGPRHEAPPEYLKVFVSRLRAKLEPKVDSPHYIHNERALGYRFVRQPPKDALDATGPGLSEGPVVQFPASQRSTRMLRGGESR